MDKSDDTIQLLSQDGEAVETVHKELLCMFSKYYAAALQGQFLEARAEQLKVQLDSMDLLLFKTWLYTGYLFTKDIPTLITFYVFADRTDMLALRRTVMRELARTVMKKPALTVEAPAEKEPVKLAHVRLVLDNLPESSPLCHWMFTYYCYHWKPSQPLHCSADYDDEPELTGFVRSGYDRWDRGFVRETALNSQDDSTDELFEMVESGDCTCCHDICNWFEYQNQDDWEASKFVIISFFPFLFEGGSKTNEF